MSTTKICDHCHQELPATDRYFDFSLRSRDHFKSYCRKCSPAVAAERRRRKNEKAREWARKNREKARASSKKSYEANREERLAYYRRWRRENKEHINEYSREYAERKRQDNT
jgi:hypothetical protein